MSACQAECRRFEPDRLLHFSMKEQKFKFYETKIQLTSNTIINAEILSTSAEKAYQFYIDKFGKEAILYKPRFKSDYTL